jgi:hypothetical protein
MDHNLDISMYSLKDILGLFDLEYEINIDDMKRAKKKVLMTHPDKSKLDAKYFLFYKKAFDIIVKFYDSQNRQNRDLSSKNTEYIANDHNHHDSNTSSSIEKKIKEFDTHDFHNKFNRIFEENMINTVDSTKNEWFTNEDTGFSIEENVTSGNMGRVLDNVRDKQDTIVKYSGVKTLNAHGSASNDYYDDDESNSYVESDPFSKLKFDDLRKVHKDQTIFNVSEKDYGKVKKYSSVDHFMRERSGQSTEPLEKQKAELLLRQQDKQYREKMMHKEYQSTLRTDEYANKNKNILARFLQIKN